MDVRSVDRQFFFFFTICGKIKFSRTIRRSIGWSTDCSLIELDSRIAPKNIWVGVFYKVEKNISVGIYFIELVRLRQTDNLFGVALAQFFN